MGKIIGRKINGMSRQAKIALTVLFTILAGAFIHHGWYYPMQTYAALSRQANWSSQYAAVAFPNGAVNSNYTIAAGSNRLLVVAIASTTTAAATKTVSVTYGGRALTLAAGDGTVSRWNHTFLYYLKEADIQSASGSSLNVTISGGSSYYNYVYAAVYNGVDQAAPFTDAKNYNNSSANSTVGPFSPTLTINANDQAIEILNLARSSSGTTARTISTWATGWTTAGQAPSPITTSGPCATLYIRDRAIPASTTNDGSQHTASSTSTYDSMTAMSIKAATDTTPPTVTINQAAGQADPTATSPINFTVVFSETVTNFATGDVTVTGTAGGAKTATVTGSGTTYNVAVSGMTTQGTVIASINAGVATDAAGNGNTASTSTDNTVTWDATGPAVTINQAGGQSDPTASSPINFTVVFSESVANFATGDVTLSGTAGATTATVTGSGTTYNVAVSGMVGSGTVIATIGAGKATDSAGNPSAASTSTDNTVTYDITPPTGLDAYLPLDEAVDQPLNVTLQSTTATDSAGPVQYYFQISDDNTFATNVNTGGWQSGTSYTPPARANGVTYFWRVKARDALGNETTYSTPRSFSTIAACVRNDPTLTLLTATGGVASTITSDHGTSVYNLKVINNDYGGCASTQFNLSISDTDNGNNFDPPILSSTAVTLAPGAQTTVSATITATAGKASGQSSARAQSAADANHAQVISNDVTTNINVVACYPQMPLLIIGPDASYVDKGGSVGYTITIKNTDTGTGCSQVTYNLSILSETNAPSVDFNASQLSASSLVLNSGQTGSVTLTVTSKPAGTKGQVNVTTIAVSATGHSSPANITATSTIGNPLLHNSDNTASIRWSANGGWGLPNTRYGEFVCTTCHVAGGADTRSIQRIRESITTPDTSKGTLPGDGQPIVFNRTVGSNASQGVFGWDAGVTPRTSSTRICEICHTHDATAANGVKYHPFATALALGNHQGADGQDCISCHRHNKGFNVGSLACDACHGNPPLSGPTGGAHATHTTVPNFRGCATCHTGGMLTAYVTNGMTDIGFNAFSTTTGSYDGRVGVTYSAGNTNSGAQSCSNVYCHGSTMGTNGGSNQTPVWITNSTGACGTCHGATAANPPTLGSHAKHSGSTGLSLPCADCHKTYVPSSIPSNMATHVNNRSDTALDITKSYVGATATYTGTNTMLDAYGYCNNVYCHTTVQGTNGVGAGANKTQQWGAAGPLNCSACHADMSGASATASHIKHTNSTAGNYNMPCANCHAGYTASTLNSAIHTNNSIDVALGSGTYSGGSTQGNHAPGGGYGTCTNNYCHSNGKGGYPSTNPLWGSASTGACGTCHGVIASSLPASAAHAKHVGSAAGQYKYSCAKCHATVVSATADSTTAPTITSVTLHVNSAFDVAYDSYNTGATSCQTTYCHSQGTGGTGQSGDARPFLAPAVVPTWTSSASCSMCHTGGTTTGPTYANATPKANSHDSHTKAGVAFACDVCHYSVTTNGTTITTPANHVNKVYDVSANTAKTPAFTYTYNSTGGTCRSSACHGGGIPKWGTNSAAAQCHKCHGSKATAFATISSAQVAPGYGADGQDTAGNTAATSPRVGTHQAHLQALDGFSDRMRCSECHTLHPAVTDSTHLNYTTATITFSGRATAQAHAPTVTRAGGVITCNNTYCHTGTLNSGAAMSPVWNNTSYLSATMDVVNCSKCHGMPPTPGSGAHATISATISSFPTTSCNCHNNLSATGTTYANIFVDKTKHLNGIIEGGTCVSCHGLQQGTGTRQVVGTDTALASHHIQSGAIDSATCVVCHEQTTFGHKTAGNDVAVGMFNQDTGAALNYDGTNTTATNLETACASCHDSNGASRLGANASKPFTGSGDNTAPVNINWTPGGQAHSNTGAGTQPGCFKCHGKSGAANTTLDPKFNAHGSATTKILQYGYTAGSEQTFCYTCHGTTVANGAVNAIQPLFAKTRKHSVQSCNNCHNKHQAKAGTHTVRGNTAGGVLNGAAGAKLTTNPAFWTAPTAGSFTAASIVSGTDLEATLCFKCHSIYSAGYNTTSPSGSFAMTDISKEFNPNNTGNFAGSWATNETAGGFHPVLATAGSNLGAVKLANLVTTNIAWSTSARNLMTCSDCHGSNTTTDPLGPHGSAANFLLRGPNTTWSSTVTLGSSIPAGTFCLNCHASSFTNSRFPDHSRSDHYVACFNCHAAIPHGGPRPGMLISPAGAATAVGGTIAGWDTTAPYWGLGSSSNKLYIKTYPTTNTNNWGQSNCGCNGTGH